ncbi:MAG: pyrophosphokinae [Thermoanaerobaculia bacterium]|jgi:ppGpp synthetase/RelA/SpoT-type nucleotidyltranferase|nr:pyrophosphokinae [Thermoanaerobaculia bacterium]
MQTPSKAQIDRLGERLRGQAYGEAELRSLDEYRRTFGPAYDRVVADVQRIIGVPVSGRPAKSTGSIIEQLNRESIRLSQMQDIAGCRAIVADVPQQDGAVDAIVRGLKNVAILDRRERPSYGYRAVHLIVRVNAKPVEVQVRTSLQHVWAETSEKLADVIDPSIKYGGGPENARRVLDRAAAMAYKIEELEAKLLRIGASDGEVAQELRETRDEYISNLRSLMSS